MNAPSLRMGQAALLPPTIKDARDKAVPSTHPALAAGGSCSGFQDFGRAPDHAAQRVVHDHGRDARDGLRSEEHTSELQSHVNLVCRLLLEKKKKNQINTIVRE